MVLVLAQLMHDHARHGRHVRGRITDNVHTGTMSTLGPAGYRRGMTSELRDQLVADCLNAAMQRGADTFSRSSGGSWPSATLEAGTRASSVQRHPQRPGELPLVAAAPPGSGFTQAQNGLRACVSVWTLLSRDLRWRCYGPGLTKSSETLR